jgi:uncharacterized phosphosugar-binding protein
MEMAANHPARHSTGKNLYELVDIVVDSKVEVGDATVEIQDLEQRVAAMSTFANAFCLNAIVAAAVELLIQEGVTPSIWMSGNAPGGDEANARFIERFKGRIKKL